MSEAHVCAVTTLAVVGTVVGRASFVPGGTDWYGDAVFSIVTLQVEGVLVGAPTPTVQFLIMGGTLPDGRGMWAEDFPTADVGTRYLALFNVQPGVRVRLEPGVDLRQYVESYPGPIIIDVFELSGTSELIPETEMRALWTKHCSGPEPVNVGLPNSVLRSSPAGTRN
jgi:hypothetical protein